MAIIPNDFLWHGLWDRKLIRVHYAWELLRNAKGIDYTFGDPNIILAINDYPLWSTLGIPLYKDDLAGSLKPTITTYLVSDAAPPVSSEIFIPSADIGNFNVSDEISVGPLGGLFSEIVKILSIDLSLNKFTTEPLIFNHKIGQNIYLSTDPSISTSIVVQDIVAAQSKISVNSISGFQIGMIISIGVEGSLEFEHVGIRNIIGNDIYSTPLKKNHIAGITTEVSRSKKVYHLINFATLPPYKLNHDSDNEEIHGLSVAAIAHSNTDQIDNPEYGLIGIVPNCRALYIGSGDDTAESVLWATGLISLETTLITQHFLDPGIDIYSQSFTIDPVNPSFENAINRIRTRGRKGRGTIPFLSAGNDNKHVFDNNGTSQGVIDANIISASTVIENGKEIRANYSNYGNAIDFCAPAGNQRYLVHNSYQNKNLKTWTATLDNYGNLVSKPLKTSFLTQVANAGPQTVLTHSFEPPLIYP